MVNLNDLGLKYKTDKASSKHNYLHIYEIFFEPLRDSKINLLEIGILDGASLRMWEEYFQKGEIYAMDIDPKKLLNFGRVKSYDGNQEDRNELINIAYTIGKFDIIIDDGGHTMMQQQVTLGCLFPFLKKGGIYCIEDLHTSYMRKRSGFNKDRTLKTTLKMLEELSKSGKIDSDYINKNEALYIEQNMTTCEILKGNISEIAFLKK